MRFGLRIGPGYPWKKYIGDVITFGNSTREQVETIREQMATGKWHDLVELTDAGDVQHRVVTTVDFGDIKRHRCLDCGATRSGVHPPEPPCPGETA